MGSWLLIYLSVARKGGLLAANVTPRLSCLQRKLHYFEFLSPLSETEEQGPVGSTEVNIGQAGVRRLSLLTTQGCDRWFLQQNSTTQVHMQEEPDSLHQHRQEHWTRPSAVRRDSQKKRIEVIDFSSHVDVADSCGQFKMPRCVTPSNA